CRESSPSRFTAGSGDQPPVKVDSCALKEHSILLDRTTQMTLRRPNSSSHPLCGGCLTPVGARKTRLSSINGVRCHYKFRLWTGPPPPVPNRQSAPPIHG